MEYKKDYFGFVYLWYDTKHKKFIIGSHHGSIHDGYKTSTGGIHVQRIFKVRPETMFRKILAYNTIDEVKTTRAIEQKFLSLRPDIIDNPRYYNQNNTALGGIGGWDHVNNDPNHINPMSTPEGKANHKARMEECVAKDPHHFCKNSLGDNNPMKRYEVWSKHPSSFTTENNPMNDPEIRASNQRIQTEISGRRVSVCGVEYPSANSAARALGFSTQRLRHRLKVPSFPDHYYIEEDE